MKGRAAPAQARRSGPPPELRPPFRSEEEKAAAVEPTRVVLIEEDPLAAGALAEFFRLMVVDTIELRLTSDVVDAAVRFQPDAVMLNVDPPDSAVVAVAGALTLRLPDALIVCPSRTAARRVRRLVPQHRLLAIEKPYSIERLLMMMEVILNRRPLVRH